ncbi:hypothetical protein [Pedosphaera parvula]|uniref:Uncharacterized protein n=1 Tax=Pedosphaera parvula (strain Ellin514) TaxID=320771 RepID=B9XF47_PEDPL|nr:hypothetical protein [Pedosphaera parvula]EEF61545.1 hypothetical protein Cflav_PD4223 [Pedosphaera parvula Ellin514]
MSINTHYKKVVEDRPPLSDAEFVLGLDVPPELYLFIATIREALAGICSLPAFLIYPEDTPESLLQLADDQDEPKVVLTFEDILDLHVEININHFMGWRFFWLGKAGGQSVGEWTVSLAKRLYGESADAHAC